MAALEHPLERHLVREKSPWVVFPVAWVDSQRHLTCSAWLKTRLGLIRNKCVIANKDLYYRVGGSQQAGCCCFVEQRGTKPEPVFIKNM